MHDDKKLKEMIGSIKCPKDFICYKSGFETLCKAEDVGKKSVLLCLEEKPEECKFSLPIGLKYYCQCPIRVFIRKKYNK